MNLMFTLPDLPYDVKALEPFIDVETMMLHHDRHHAAYVKNTNEALAESPELLEMDPVKLYLKLDLVPEKVRTKVKNNLGGHINHSMFWEIMCSPKDYKQLEDDSLLNKKIMEDLGSWSGFQVEFEEQAMGRFGSGWVWLVEEEGKLGIISTPNQDNPLLEGKKPILGLDVWEHAYYLKYKNMRADYVKAWWNVVNWKKVSENFNNS